MDGVRLVEKYYTGYGMRYEYISKDHAVNVKHANALTTWFQAGENKRFTIPYITKTKTTDDL